MRRSMAVRACRIFRAISEWASNFSRSAGQFSAEIFDGQSQLKILDASTMSKHFSERQPSDGRRYLRDFRAA